MTNNYISDEGDALFVNEQEQLAYEEQHPEEFDLDLDDEDEELEDLSHLYTQDDTHAGEIVSI